MLHKLIIGISALTLVLLSICTPAVALSPAGLVAYTATTIPITVPAGTSVSTIGQVTAVVPADVSPTISVAYRVILFTTASSTNTTATVALDGTSETSAAVTVPAGLTVPIFLETMLQSTAGAILEGSITVTAGSGGAVTVQPNSSVTFEAVPTFAGESEYVYKSRW
ncbi:MAG: hypothetical protein JO071_04380 [Deltaproteobacteria bacterium]|nr:hypothetical protein [Deltaproteobacteria bacterium]